MKRNKLFVIIIGLLLVSIISGCMSSDETEQDTTTIPENQEETEQPQEETETPQEEQEEKIIEVIGEDESVKVYYFGYDKEVVNFEWNIDGVILQDDKGEHHIILNLNELPHSLIPEKVQTSKYIEASEIMIKPTPVILFEPVSELDNKAVVELYKDGEGDGYLIIIPKDENVITVSPQVDSVSIELEKGEETNKIQFNAEVVIDIGENLPSYVSVKPMIKQKGVFISDAEYNLESQRMLRIRVYGTVDVSVLTEKINSSNNDYIDITLNYEVHGAQVFQTGVEEEDEFGNELNTQGKPLIEALTAGVTFTPLALYEINFDLKTVLPEEDFLDFPIAKYILYVNMEVDLPVIENDETLTFIEVFVNGDSESSMYIRVDSRKENTAHLTVPIYFNSFEDEIEVVVLDSQENELFRESIIVSDLPVEGLKPIKIAEFDYHVDGTSLIIDYEPLITQDDVVLASDVLSKLEGAVKVGDRDLTEYIQNRVLDNNIDVTNMINFLLAPGFSVVIEDKHYYVDGDLVLLLNLLIQNKDKEILLDNMSVTVTSYEKIIEFIEYIRNKLIIDNLNKSYFSTEEDDTQQEGGYMLILPVTGTFDDVIIYGNKEASTNVEFAPLLSFGVIQDIFKPAKIVYDVYMQVYCESCDSASEDLQRSVFVTAMTSIYPYLSPTMQQTSLISYPIIELKEIQLTLEPPVSEISEVPSGDYIVGKFMEYEDEEYIVNIDLTEHIGLTPEDIDEVEDYVMWSAGTVSVFVAEDGHLIAQIPVSVDYTTIEIPTQSGVISMNLSDLEIKRLVDYTFEKIDASHYKITVNNALVSEYEFLMFFPVEMTEEDYTILINKEENDSVVYEQYLPFIGVQVLTITANKSLKTIDIIINNQELVDEDFEFYVFPFKRPKGVSVQYMLSSTKYFAVIGDFVSNLAQSSEVVLEVVSPVTGVYYQAGTEASALDESALNFDLNGDGDTSDSVSPKYLDLTSIVTIKGKNLNGKMLTISVASPNWYIYDGSKVQKTAQLDISAVPFTPSGTLHLIRAGAEPFNMPEFVELIFAVGDTARAEVTIVVEP